MIALALALPAAAQEAAPDDEDPTDTTPAPLMPGPPPGVQLGQHRFTLTFEPTAIEGMDAVRRKFVDEGVFQGALDSLADQIALPQDIPVTFKDCDDENAFWDSEDKSLTMCWDLIALYNRGYEQVDGEEAVFLKGADQGTVLTGTTLFIFMHELGHGMIDLFHLPITGREEDAVDQFAAVMLTGEDEPGDALENRISRLALMGAYFFYQIASEPGDLNREIFADEHALGQQRYYDVMCFVLGSDPDTYAPILTPGMVTAAVEADEKGLDGDQILELFAETDDENILPSARAVGCEDEYRRYYASWEYLIRHFMVPQAS